MVLRDRHRTATCPSTPTFRLLGCSWQVCENRVYGRGREKGKRGQQGGERKKEIRPEAWVQETLPEARGRGEEGRWTKRFTTNLPFYSNLSLAGMLMAGA